ncbi:MAG: 4Fe-4S binding protein [Candidatus Margulisbacteria bacterium]|jgi:NAD-dependent dihydropyrimidine dehydrogenase PreA subunit|nr:4Fe-4S binding protein [Candidatus Margulisiibacteriota bacterium]
MVKRQIVKIDEEKCNGCGLCIPNCHEGALQIVDGKARLVSEVFCDGLGACLGHCPQGAITLEEREAIPFMEQECGCPGAAVRAFRDKNEGEAVGNPASQLRQWPVQLHLVPPGAPYFKGADLLLAADCVAYSLGGFHGRYLRGRALAIACPKLDQGQEIYLEKLIALIDQARINTLTVMIMEVPCCGGLLQLAKTAQAQAKRKIPLKAVVVGLEGDILKEDWVS